MEDVLGLLNEGLSIATNAKALGAILAFVAVIKLLVKFSKSALGEKLTTKLLGTSKTKRSILAAVLGAALAAGTALAEHKPWLQVLLAGLAGAMAGATASGIHEVLTHASSKDREAREAAEVIEHALTGGDAEVKAKVDALKAQLDEAAGKGDSATRLSHIAAFMRGHPPKA